MHHHFLKKRIRYVDRHVGNIYPTKKLTQKKWLKEKKLFGLMFQKISWKHFYNRKADQTSVKVHYDKWIIEYNKYIITETAE